MTDAVAGRERYTTRRLAVACGYSVQQVRDLEHIGVIPPAVRHPNGYRQFVGTHVIALCAYRELAIAVGPVVARSTMQELWRVGYGEAISRIVALHVELARDRESTTAALDALDAILSESAREAAPVSTDAMNITELSEALGVRSSTLRFWEQEGLITAQREARRAVRRYPPATVTDARIVASLRAGGYRIPDVRRVMTALHALGDPADARAALQDRLQSIAARSAALLRAGSGLVGLLDSASEDTA